MTRFLHFGAGPNKLPEPWENLDATHDIRKPLRFLDNSVKGIAAEHVIEHVPFLMGFAFMREAVRVLEPGGVLRIAFPDVGRFLMAERDADDPFQNTFKLAPNVRPYAEGLSKRPASMSWFGNDPPKGEALDLAALRLMMTGWGHAMAWTQVSAAGALLVAGFSLVHARGYGYGKLEGIDGHHLDVGPELARLETTVLEATK